MSICYPAGTDKTNCINDDCFTRNENEDLTNLKGEHFSGEGDIQTPTLTDKCNAFMSILKNNILII